MLADLFITEKCLYVGNYVIGSQSQEEECTGLYKHVDWLIQNAEVLFVLLFSVRGHFDVSCIRFLTALKCCVWHILLLLLLYMFHGV